MEVYFLLFAVALFDRFPSQIDHAKFQSTLLVPEPVE